MTKLCARGKAAAKRKFAVYPSAYANAYASKICAGKIKDPSGKKKKDWGPKKASKGASIKINRVASKLEKASKAHAAQARTLRTIKAKNGKHMDDDGRKYGPGPTFKKPTIKKMPVLDRPIKKKVLEAREGEYIGSYVKGDLAGKKVSNKSYRNYYKGMIDV